MLILYLIQKVVEVVSLKVIWHRECTADSFPVELWSSFAEDTRTKVVSSLHTLCLSESLTPCFVCRLLWLFMSQLTVSSTASLFVRRWFVSFCLHFISQADIGVYTRCYSILFSRCCLLEMWTRGMSCHRLTQENIMKNEIKSFWKSLLGRTKKSRGCQY